MNNAEFKSKLSEVAVWKIPDTPRETSLNAKKKRGRPSKEELYQEEHEEVFLELFNGENPTYAPMIVKLKIAAVECNDCGRLCENGCHKEKKLYDTANKPHWRERCLTCNKARNPYTGAFDLTIAQASVVWNSYLRDSKGIYASKGNLAKEVNEDHITITSWPETERMR